MFDVWMGRNDLSPGIRSVSTRAAATRRRIMDLSAVERNILTYVETSYRPKFPMGAIFMTECSTDHISADLLTKLGFFIAWVLLT